MSSAGYNILEYGAVAGENEINTKAVQAAVDACAENGGGRVLVPAGTFLTGTIFLKDNVELHLTAGAVLKGSPDLADYNADDCIPQNRVFAAEQVTGGHLIIAAEVRNVSITGPGTIDGNVFAFLDGFTPSDSRNGHDSWGEGRCIVKESLRPGQMLFFCECEQVRVENVTLQNSPYWTCFLHGCEEVFLQGVKICNDPRILNTDGIDLDCCRNAVVTNCIIETGDDAFAIRACREPLRNRERKCENIAISNCVVSSQTDAFRIGVGDGVIRNVVISNILGHKLARGICIQTKYIREQAGCEISDIRISNLRFSECRTPFFIAPGLDGTKRIGDISISGFSVDSCKTGSIFGNGRSRPANIRLRDVALRVTGRLPSEDHHRLDPEVFREWSRGLDCAVYIADTDDVVLEDFHIFWACDEPGWKHGLIAENNRDLVIAENCRLPEPETKE